MKPIFIYALKDPETRLVRYIGVTKNIRQRFLRHLKNARNNEKYHSATWIRSLLMKNLKPDMQILTEVVDGRWEFWEREYIKLYREIGFDLTNHTAGGEGSFGYTHGPEALEKIRQKRANQISPMKGRTHTLEARQKQSNSHIGHIPWNKGIPQSAEAKTKMSAALKGRVQSSEAREKNRLAHLGKKKSPEVILNFISAQQKRRQQEKLIKGT